MQLPYPIAMNTIACTMTFAVAYRLYALLMQMVEHGDKYEHHSPQLPTQRYRHGSSRNNVRNRQRVGA